MKRHSPAGGSTYPSGVTPSPSTQRSVASSFHPRAAVRASRSASRAEMRSSSGEICSTAEPQPPSANVSTISESPSRFIPILPGAGSRGRGCNNPARGWVGGFELLHPVVVVDLREVPLAGVGEDRDDAGLGVIDLACDPHGDARGESGRTADEEPFLTCDASRHPERVEVGDGDELVDPLEPERRRDLVAADAFDLVRPSFADLAGAGEARVDRSFRVAGDDPDRGVPLLQVLPRPADRPARAGRADEVRD